MKIPINLFMWIIATLPIIILLVLIIKLRWGAAGAAPVGLAVAVINGITFYKADLSLMVLESAKGIWNSAIILTIIWPAILLFEVIDEAKGFAVIRKGVKKLLPNELLQLLAMGWIFVSFLQGITGFGVPVAVGAPLLIGIGVNPLWAVIISLVGCSWGNTFGTLAVAWDALTMSTNLAAGSAIFIKAAMNAACFLWIWNIMIGIIICWFYGRKDGVKKGLPAVVAISLIHGGGQLLLTRLNTTIACFIPACVALIVIFLLGKTKRYKETWGIENSKIMNHDSYEYPEKDLHKDMKMSDAFAPYAILTAITLFVLLIPEVTGLLNKVTLGFSFPETETGYGFKNTAILRYSPVNPLTHAGSFLFIAALTGILLFIRAKWLDISNIKSIFKRSIIKTIPSGIAIIGFIVMSKVMSGSGQTMVLAFGISAVLGKGYALLAPIVGILGSFMTSSNMASNVLFGEFQLTTSQLLGLDIAAVLGAQTAGGAIGNTISPGSIILGTTTANIIGKEGSVLKKIFPITLTAAAIMGIILFITQIIYMG